MSKEYWWNDADRGKWVKSNDGMMLTGENEVKSNDGMILTGENE